MSEVDGRANRREPMELYRPGALNEEREKHRRRAHFGENRVNNGQQQPQQHHRYEDENGGSRRVYSRGRGKKPESSNQFTLNWIFIIRGPFLKHSK